MSDSVVTALYYLGTVLAVLTMIGLALWSYLKNSPNQFHTLFEKAMKMTGADHNVIFVSKLDREVRILEDEIFRRECLQIENSAAIESCKSQRMEMLRLRTKLNSDKGDSLDKAAA